MQLTRQADYAVRIVLDLAGRSGQRNRTAEIGRRQRIPPAYLRKIIQHLARAGFVRTLRGVDGGVSLVRGPAAITLRQVVEAVEGPLRLNRCLVRPGECVLDRVCPVHPVWRRIQEVLVRELDAVTFADLAQEGRRLAGGRPAG